VYDCSSWGFFPLGITVMGLDYRLRCQSGSAGTMLLRELERFRFIGGLKLWSIAAVYRAIRKGVLVHGTNLLHNPRVQLILRDWNIINYWFFACKDCLDFVLSLSQRNFPSILSPGRQLIVLRWALMAGEVSLSIEAKEMPRSAKWAGLKSQRLMLT